MREQLNLILSKHTGQPMEQIVKDTDRNYFMSADECKAYGIVDEIIEKRNAQQGKEYGIIDDIIYEHK